MVICTNLILSQVTITLIFIRLKHSFWISSDLSGVALIVIFVSPSCLLGSSLPLSFHQNFPWSSSFLERIGHPCRVVFG